MILSDSVMKYFAIWVKVTTTKGKKFVTFPPEQTYA